MDIDENTHVLYVIELAVCSCRLADGSWHQPAGSCHLAAEATVRAQGITDYAN